MMIQTRAGMRGLSQGEVLSAGTICIDPVTGGVTDCPAGGSYSVPSDAVPCTSQQEAEMGFTCWSSPDGSKIYAGSGGTQISYPIPAGGGTQAAGVTPVPGQPSGTPGTPTGTNPNATVAGPLGTGSCLDPMTGLQLPPAQCTKPSPSTLVWVLLGIGGVMILTLGVRAKK